VQGLQRKVYFVTGHGEKDPNGADERGGYSGANAALQRDNYTVDTLALAQQPEVPADAAALVVAGPTRDFLPAEIDALRRFLNKGGKALLMLDPSDTPDAAPLTNLIALAAEWGIEVGANVVVDQSSIGQAVGRGPVAPVVVAYPTHPITERFRYMTMFPLARSVTPATSGGRNAQPLFQTSAQSWAETNLKDMNERRAASYDSADQRGPGVLGAAVNFAAPDAPAPTPPATPKPGEAPPEPPKRAETRVVVIGDSDFASNEALGFEGNSDLFMNTINWVAEQENLIAIRPKSPDDRRVTMTEDQLRLVGWLSLIFVPGAVFAIGVYTWWRRRG
jgi:ABC-type uncharacterized transport system involved in gliding motility auxiliary subunit